VDTGSAQEIRQTQEVFRWAARLGVCQQRTLIIVSKAELGTKRLCGNCGAKFYDVLKDPIVCPKCSTVFVPPAVTPPGSRRVNQYARPRTAATMEIADIGPGEDVAADDDREEKELNDTTDDGGLIVLNEHDEDDQGVGDMHGSDVKKDDPT
jgi:uncharacterized protein (TIGR02300 family)